MQAAKAGGDEAPPSTGKCYGIPPLRGRGPEMPYFAAGALAAAFARSAGVFAF